MFSPAVRQYAVVDGKGAGGRECKLLFIVARQGISTTLFHSPSLCVETIFTCVNNSRPYLVSPGEFMHRNITAAFKENPTKLGFEQGFAHCRRL